MTYLQPDGIVSPSSWRLSYPLRMLVADVARAAWRWAAPKMAGALVLPFLPLVFIGLVLVARACMDNQAQEHEPKVEPAMKRCAPPRKRRIAER